MLKELKKQGKGARTWWSLSELILKSSIIIVIRFHIQLPERCLQRSHACYDFLSHLLEIVFLALWYFMVKVFHIFIMRTGASADRVAVAIWVLVNLNTLSECWLCSVLKISYVVIDTKCSHSSRSVSASWFRLSFFNLGFVQILGWFCIQQFHSFGSRYLSVGQRC